MRIWHSESVRGLALTLLCLFCVIAPLFAGPGPVNTRGGGDSPFLLVRLEQMVASLRAGAFPVRWMPDAAYGQGYPFFNFYAALPYYIAAVYRLLGWGPILSIQVTQALGFVLAALSMTLLAQRVLDHPAAVTLAVIAYTCAPFHLVNVYVRGDSLSEFYAFVFYPLIFWALLRVRDVPTWRNVAWVAASYSGLILTHNLSAVMFSPFVVLYALYLLVPRAQGKQPQERAFWQQIEWRSGLLMISGGILGLALSATLWLTAVVDLDSVWMGTRDIQTSGFFNYEGHLRGRDLVQGSLAFDYEVSPGRTPFAMGAVQAASIALGALAVIAGWMQRSSKQARWSRFSSAFWLGGLILSTWLITPLSRPLWAHLPVLSVVQFPWRFLSIQAFFGALIAGESARRLPRSWWVAVTAAVALLAATLGGLRPEYLPIHENDVTPGRLALFESFTTNIGTTIRGEYLPNGVDPRPYASTVTLHQDDRPAPVALTGAVVHAELVRRDARSAQWRIETNAEDTHFAFHTLYLDGWRAWVDGSPVEIEPLSGSGRISLHVPRGTHTVDLRFGWTAARRIADLISLAAGLVVIALLWPWIRTLRAVSYRHVRNALTWGLVCLGTLVIIGGMLSASTTAQSEDDLSMDFSRMPFLHHNPQGIDFGQARLAHYTYQDTVQGGETLSVTLHWGQQRSDMLARVSLVMPAAMHPDLSPFPAPLAQAQAHIEGSITVHLLTVPADAASGTYYLALQVFDAQQEVSALTTMGKPLGTTYLRPVWIDNPRPAREDDPILARLGDRILLRDDVAVRADDQGWQVKLTWQATQPIATNYSCSLRIIGADGRQLPGAQRDFDGGPGYGFWPTSSWPVSEWLTDRMRLPVPEGVAAEEAAALQIVLYQPGLSAVGSVIVPLVEREHRYKVPPMAHPVGAVFGEQAELLGYDLTEDAAQLRLALYWRAAKQMPTDWTVFVHLFDPDTEEIVAQWDAKPLYGAYPTNWWRPQEIIHDEVVLGLESVPKGRYYLGVGLYDAKNSHRPPISLPSGETMTGGRLVLETLSIKVSP
jgi:hypothetical protein